MQSFNHYPLVRLIFPLLIGIVIAFQTNSSHHIPLYVFLFFLIAFIFFIFFQKKFSYSFRWAGGVLINILFVLFGYEIALQKNVQNNPEFFGHYISNNQYAIANVISNCENKQNAYKFVVQIEKTNNLKWLNTFGKALIYLKKEGCHDIPQVGDKIIIKTNFNEISPPQNPHEFDFKKYLALNNIYYQSFVKSSEYSILAHDQGNFLLTYSIRLQKKISGIFAQSKMSKEEYAITSALIIGDRDYLDRETVKSYSNTGVIHILSVSGLHVGIIYLFFEFIFSFLLRFKYGKSVKIILIIFLIWFYALITGMSPPVLRASAMITFIIIGKSLSRSINMFNTLAASAFLLLIIDPNILMDVGFQLSYLAVAGIVIFYQKIYQQWLPENRWIDKLWGTIAVSLAAQILAFPLVLYYFHQFPNYFIFANFFAIPLSSLIMYVGMLMIIFYPLKMISDFISIILLYLIKWMNLIIKFFSDLPFSTIQHISINLQETLLIYLIILFIALFFLLNKKKYFFISGVCSLLLVFSVVYKEYLQMNQQKFFVYDIHNSSVYEFYNGKTSILLSDSTTINDRNIKEFHIEPNRIYSGIADIKEFSIDSKFVKDEHILKTKEFIQFQNHRIVIIDNSNAKKNTSKSIKVDYLIIRKNPKIKINELVAVYQPQHIIFDSSNSLWRIKKWKEECKQNNINCFSIPEQGYFEI